MENNYQAPMQQPQMQPPMPSMSQQPKKKGNVGLIIAIVAVAIAIVAVSVLGLMMFGGFGSGKKVEAITTAIRNGDITSAMADYESLRDNAREENAPAFAAELAILVKANPYDAGDMIGFAEDDIARFVEYNAFAQAINLRAYQPATADYIDAVCALEPYVQYNPIVEATLGISDHIMEGLNNCTTGFNYMASNYMALGAGYLDTAIACFDDALVKLEGYDMSGVMMQEYHDAIVGMRDASEVIADAGRRGDFTALLSATEDYTAAIESFQGVTEEMSTIVSEITVLMDDVDTTYAAL